MNDLRHEALIGTLAGGLRPVRRLPPPGRRAAIWMALVLAFGAVLAGFSDLRELAVRLVVAPDLGLALAGSWLTAGLAAFAAFQTSVPGRRGLWAWLPAPGLALWLGASGLGCLRSWLAPGTHDASLAESMDCLRFIIGLSVPLAALTLVMLRRAAPLRPGLTAGLAGLAVAAAAASLLELFHPFDAALSDLSVHGGAVLLVIALHRIFGQRIFSAPRA